LYVAYRAFPPDYVLPGNLVGDIAGGGMQAVIGILAAVIAREKTGEGQFVEFKEKLDNSLIKEIVAFANASGGKIFLGVDDSGKIKGISNTNRLKSQIVDYGKNCDPEIPLSLETLDNIEVDETINQNGGINGGLNGGIKLSKNQQAIIKTIFEVPDVTLEVLAEKVGIPLRSVERNIAILKEKGILDRIGSRKTGYWKIETNELEALKEKE